MLSLNNRENRINALLTITSMLQNVSVKFEVMERETGLNSQQIKRCVKTLNRFGLNVFIDGQYTRNKTMYLLNPENIENALKLISNETNNEEIKNRIESFKCEAKGLRYKELNQNNINDAINILNGSKRSKIELLKDLEKLLKVSNYEEKIKVAKGYDAWRRKYLRASGI